MRGANAQAAGDGKPQAGENHGRLSEGVSCFEEQCGKIGIRIEFNPFIPALLEAREAINHGI
jgi:hypothetical protein